MFNTTNMCLRSASMAMLFVVCDAETAEWAIESDVNSHIEYNDNIFLTTQDHQSVSGLIVTPSLKMLAREKNWETSLNTMLRSNNYSDSNIDSNDIYFDLTGRYLTERNTYSLNGTLDFDTNLNSESSDFGITGRRTKREIRSISPMFTRMINERLRFSIRYLYSDIDYKDAENTGFTPSTTDTVSGSLAYSISERDQVNFVLESSMYESNDNSIKNETVTARIGMSHTLSESFSVNYLIGSNQSDTTNRSTQTFIFFGQPITFTQITDFSDSGVTYDAGFEQKWLTSVLSGHINRVTSTDSFGNLNVVNGLGFDFEQKVTRLLSYSVRIKYEEVESVSSSNQFADRELFLFEPNMSYKLDKSWSANASYRYIRRKFDSQTDGQTPDSNRIFIGLTYDFPSISTF